MPRSDREPRGGGGSTASQQAPLQPVLTPSAAVRAGYREHLEPFWAGALDEVGEVGLDPAEFKNHHLPLARIKKIMKSDEDVRMISAEAPVLFAKACELFILELTLRAWVHAEDRRGRTLQRCDVASAVAHKQVFDFLTDVVPLVDEAGKPVDAAALAAEQAAQAAAAASGGGSGSSRSRRGEAAAAAAAAAAAGQQQQQQQYRAPGVYYTPNGMPYAAGEVPSFGGYQ